MDAGFAWLLVQALAALAAVLGLFALLVWAFRRLPWNGAKLPRAFSVEARIAVDSRHQILAVRHEGRRYLIALGPAGLVQLDPGRALATPDKPEAEAKE